MTDPSERNTAALAVLDQSAIVRRSAGAIDRIVAASHTSVLLRLMRPVAAAWRHAPHPERLRAAGVTLIIASVVHVSLTIFQRLPDGWMWLVVPGIAVAQGVVLVAAGSGSRDTR